MGGQKDNECVNKITKYYNIIQNNNIFKGTGTRDLIRVKVVSLDRSWLVGLTDDL